MMTCCFILDYKIDRFNDAALSTIQSGAKEANNLKSVKVVGVEHGTMELTMPGFYLSFTQTFIPE